MDRSNAGVFRGLGPDPDGIRRHARGISRARRVRAGFKIATRVRITFFPQAQPASRDCAYRVNRRHGWFAERGSALRNQSPARAAASELAPLDPAPGFPRSTAAKAFVGFAPDPQGEGDWESTLLSGGCGYEDDVSRTIYAPLDCENPGVRAGTTSRLDRASSRNWRVRLSRCSS